MTRLLRAALLVGAASSIGSADILERILVKVNGDIITKTDLEERQVAVLRQRNQSYSQEDLKTDAGLQKVLADITPQILVDSVHELLMVQRGRELGYRMTDDQFASILENIKKENRIESEEQFQAALKQEGLTVPDLRRTIEKQMLISRVQQVEVLGRIGVTESEERAYYEAHKNEFTTPATVTLREILVAVPASTAPGTRQAAVNVAADEEARDRARTIRGRILAGEEFVKVAAEMSDAPSKANGGLIGPIKRDELSPAVLDLIAPLKVGGVSEVARGQRGYQFFYLEASTQPVLQTFDEARQRIAEKVFDTKRGAEYQKYLARLRGQAIIEWKSDDLEKMYEQHLKKVGGQSQSSPSGPF
jgi:peptidyl-prolyl cis-trans isomerase SurA